jgi:hypothetical protein
MHFMSVNYWLMVIQVHELLKWPSESRLEGGWIGDHNFWTCKHLTKTWDRQGQSDNIRSQRTLSSITGQCATAADFVRLTVSDRETLEQVLRLWNEINSML